MVDLVNEGFRFRFRFGLIGWVVIWGGEDDCGCQWGLGRFWRGGVG